MRICVAQAKSEKGKVQANIENHLALVRRAIILNSDLIIFPELSLTNYEPQLASELATNLEDPVFRPFQAISDKHQIAIGVGMPTKAEKGINISMLIFQPFKERVVFSKYLLHSDEIPYFTSSDNQPFLEIKEKKIALGICYETLQREHLLKAVENNADIFIASVSKPDRGLAKAFSHFPSMAKEFKIPILMSNAVGLSDNFISNGLSSVWNEKGELLAQLTKEDQGLLVYSTDTNLTEVDQPLILKAELADLEELFQIYLNAKKELEVNGIFQWVDTYPTKAIVESDLKKGVLFKLQNGTEIIGAINISEEQEKAYGSIDWKFDDSKVLVIHRLVINPKHQRKGYAQELMLFAENLAENNNYRSIRLDAYSVNRRVIEFYKKRNYHVRGEVTFPKREFVFFCMEKEV
jgi:predicted amidohydrolase/N-acetylglutamate synthase-like GNAT family acetyltransferase